MRKYADELIQGAATWPLAGIGNRYYPARPLPFYSWLLRLREAWDVLLGRADAMYWKVDDAKEKG